MKRKILIIFIDKTINQTSPPIPSNENFSLFHFTCPF